MPSDKKLKIIHTEASPHWGGQEIRIFEEMKWFREQGHEMLLVAPDNGTLYQRCKEEGFKVISVYYTKPRTLLNILKMLWILWRLKPDVVATHSSTDSWAGLIAAYLLKIKKRVRYRHVSAPVRRNFLNKLQYSTLANLVLTTGKCIRNPLITDFKLDRKKVISVPTPVEIQNFELPKTKAKEFLIEKLGIPKDSIFVGQISVFRGWKGHRFLIESFIKIVNHDERYHLVLVGNGPVLDKTKKIARSLKYSSNIHFVGFKSDPWQYYRAFDICVLTSTKNEGIPQTLLKSMIAGTPVLGTNVGGIPEIIIDNKTGVLIEPNDQEMLINGIIKVSSDQKYSKKLVKNAFELAKHLNWSRIGGIQQNSFYSKDSISKVDDLRPHTEKTQNIVLIAHHSSWGAASNFRDMFSMSNEYSTIEINHDGGTENEYSFGAGKSGRRINIDELDEVQSMFFNPDTTIFIFDYLGLKLYKKILIKLDLGINSLPTNILWSGNPFIKHQKYCLKWAKKLDAKEYAMLDLLRLSESAIPLMQPYNLTKMDQLLEGVDKDSETITICHSPGHKGNSGEKGTDIIIDVVRTIQKEFDNIEFILLGGDKWVSNDECIKIKAGCDIFIDKVGKESAGGIGKSGIESICLGIPTISSIHKSDFSGRYSNLNIISGNTTEELYYNLRMLITKPDHLIKMKSQTMASREIFSYEKTISYLRETMNQSN